MYRSKVAMVEERRSSVSKYSIKQSCRVWCMDFPVIRYDPKSLKQMDPGY